MERGSRAFRSTARRGAKMLSTGTWQRGLRSETRHPRQRLRCFFLNRDEITIFWYDIYFVLAIIVNVGNLKKACRYLHNFSIYLMDKMF